MRRRRRRLRGLLLAVAIAWLLALVAERGVDAVFPYPVAALDRLECSTVVTAVDGTWLQVWPTSSRERVLTARWQDLSPALRAAILVSEDRGFFAHSGVDFGAVLRATVQNVTSGRVVSGASTLTMQVVRIVAPRRRTLWSKVVEAFRARQLERAIGKDRVLDLWVTHVPMGGTLRGMEAAARYWFGKAARDLSVDEAATLVAMVPAPSARAPHRRPTLLTQRRDALLDAMAQSGALDLAELAAAKARPLGASRHGWPQHAWHLCAAELAALPAGPRPSVLRSGADPALQQRLDGIASGLTGRPGDGLAIVVLDRDDGELRALVGARAGRPGALDVSRRRRSVGSTLKPFLFALAMEQGSLVTTSLLEDAPIELSGWRPANFDLAHTGRTRPADALATSANLPAIRCLLRARVEPFHALLAQLGLPVRDSGMQLDAALGTLAASPLELANAYRRFVEDPHAVGLSERSVEWTLNAMSRLPVRAGAVAGRIAWKSGTSSGRRDAWCVGVTERCIVVTWIGNLSGRGETDLVGARAAAALLGEVASAL